MALFGNNQTVTTTFVGKDNLSPVVRGIRSTLDQFKRDAGTGFGLATGLNIFELAKRGITSVIDVMRNAADMASDLAEQQSKVDVVFGESADQIHEWARGAATDFGMSERAAETAVGTLGNLLTTAGVTGDRLADMSTEVVELGADLAAFNNVDVDESLLAIRSGLTGEAEPLRRFGVLLNEARVKAKGLALGLANANGELSEAAKVQARYALILEDTATAQGNFDSTAQGAAGQAKIAAAEWEDVMTRIGKMILPIQQGITGAMRAAVGAVDALADAFHNLERVASPHLAVLEDIDDEIRRQAELAKVDADAIIEWVHAERERQEAAKRSAEQQDILNQRIAEATAPMRAQIELIKTNSIWREEEARAAGQTEEQIRAIQDATNAEIRAWEESIRTTEEVIRGTQTLNEEQGASVDVVGEAAAAIDAYDRSLRGTRESQAVAASGLKTYNAELAAYTASWHTFMSRHANNTVRSANTIATKLPEAARTVRREVREEFTLLNQGLRERRNKLNDIMDDYRYTLTHPFRVARQRNRITTLLMSEEIIRGLESNIPAVRLQAQAVRFELLQMLRGLPGWAENQVARIIASLSQLSFIPGIGNIFNHINPEDPDGRASGGPVSAGRTYVVGEKGPEILHMGSQSGHITPNHQLGWGGGDIVLQVDGEKLFRWMMRRQGREALLSPAG